MTRPSEAPVMAQVETSAGTIEYEDTGGPGQIAVFAHGLLMDGAQWRNVEIGRAHV